MLKGEVQSISSHSSNERLNNVNMHTGKIFIKKCQVRQQQLCLYLVYGC